PEVCRVPDLTELADRILAWLEPLYRDYGYLIVVCSAMLEHTFFIAWALPGGILVAIGGIYAGSGLLRLPLVILFALIGFMIGDHLDFLVGRRSMRALSRVMKGHSLSTTAVLSSRALPALILAYTNTIPRSAMFMGGAASGMPYRRFLRLSFSLASFWSVTLSLMGYWLGSNRERLKSVLQTVGVGGQLLLVLILIGVGIYYWRKSRREKRLERAP
ncbi:MAG: hypothetical protein M3281_03215, partial [Chloroflexota bacterium]|nr:hypothetical protein [Chloroflexota bacterium]